MTGSGRQRESHSEIPADQCRQLHSDQVGHRKQYSRPDHDALAGSVQLTDWKIERFHDKQGIAHVRAMPVPHSEP